MIYAGLASLSEGCPPVEGRLHTCYSPVRQSPAGGASTSPDALRLACVKPAASVHPEPGSNSPLFISIFSIFYNEFLSCLASCSSFSELRDLMSLVLFTTFTLLCLVAILSLFSCSRIRRSRLGGGCRIVPDCGCKISAFLSLSQELS